MSDDLGLVFEIALSGYGKASAEDGDINKLLKTQDAIDLMAEVDNAPSKSPEELFEACINFLNPAVRSVYQEALSLKLREKKNDIKLLNSFCIAFSKFVGPKFDKDQANLFLGLCKEYFHNNLAKNMFTYYCYDDFNPLKCGPGQTFEFITDANAHYRKQISEMTPSQRELLNKFPNVLPLELAAHNRLKQKVIADLRIKIDRILLFIVNSSCTPDLLIILDSKNSTSTAQALRSMHSMHQKNEKKHRDEETVNRARRSPALSKIESEIDSDVEIVSMTNTHFNFDEEPSARKLHRIALHPDSEIQACVDHSMAYFDCFCESGSHRVKARQFVPEEEEFQVIGDLVTTHRDFHVKLRHGIQVSNHQYILPSKRSNLFPLSQESIFLSMFAHCRSTTVEDYANAFVDVNGRLTLSHALHANEELVIHNPFVSETARDAQCCQLAMDLTDVVFKDILWELSATKTEKSEYLRNCKSIKDTIFAHQWKALVQHCIYNSVRRPTTAQQALSDIVDTVIGKYNCEGLEPGCDRSGYNIIPAWKRHLNFSSLRAAFNIETWEDRRVWRYFDIYLDYHRSLMRQNRYRIGETKNRSILQFYSTDCEFLMRPSSATDDDDDLSSLTYGSQDKQSEHDDDSGMTYTSAQRSVGDNDPPSPGKRSDHDDDSGMTYTSAKRSVRDNDPPSPGKRSDHDDDSGMTYSSKRSKSDENDDNSLEYEYDDDDNLMAM
jgi:hypothetical protein